jgi:diadenosine tetraphosphate (Ap4A) HIT family hydrolase
MKSALYCIKGKNTIVMMNKFPYVKRHLLVAPHKHCQGLDMLSDEERLDLINYGKHSHRTTEKGLCPKGLMLA